MVERHAPKSVRHARLDDIERGLTRFTGVDGRCEKQTAREGENRPDYSGFTYNAQRLHTDGSTVPEPASLLLLYCETPALKGGESLLLDGKILYRHLQEQDPELLAALEQPEAGTFGK